MKNECGMLIDMLARIRGSFSEEDFIDDEGYDRLGACVGSPVEVLGVMEIKMNRLLNKVERYEKSLQEIANSDGWLIEPNPICTVEEAYERCVETAIKSLES